MSPVPPLRAGVNKIALVVGRDAERVTEQPRAGHRYSGEHRWMQTERKGTGHAVLMARDIIAEGFDDVVVLYGDAPLINPDSLAAAEMSERGADVVVLGFRAADPTGYGRLIERDGELVAIREHKDASAKNLPLISAMAESSRFLARKREPARGDRQ
jgi:bifunctional UDP-N-acetylglucosamine pyrophosphorylase/glucosamine-1-phosphate N-acetyltransferase